MLTARTKLGLYLGFIAGLTGCMGGCPGSTPAPAPAPPPSVAPPPPPTNAPAAATGFGSIRGRVTVTRKAEKPAVVDVTKDPEVCGKTHDPASLLLGADGTLEACVVYVRGPAAPADWKKAGTYEIDQKGCHYAPRILIVPVGESVTFKSSDPVGHNVKTTYKGFNIAVSKDSAQKLACDTPEFANLACSIHPFMGGLLVVAENPWYALTDASGSFKLDKVPAGQWKLVARHEVLGKHVKEGTSVTVEADKETVLDLKFE